MTDEERVEPTEEDFAAARRLWHDLVRPSDELSSVPTSGTFTDVVAQALASQRARLVEEHEKALREEIATVRAYASAETQAQLDAAERLAAVAESLTGHKCLRVPCRDCQPAIAQVNHALRTFRAAGREKEG